MPAEFVIRLDVFNIDVAVFYKEADRLETLRSVGVEPVEMPEAAWATAHKDEGPDGHAWFSMVLKPEATMASWAHECTHIADFVMDHLGIPCNAENTEIRSYLVGHLFNGLDENMPIPDEEEFTQPTDEKDLMSSTEQVPGAFPKITPDDLTNEIVEVDYHVFPGTTVTVALLKLKNGFSVVGESACADPRNFDPMIGMELAFANGKNKLWPLLGFRLRDQLAAEA